MKPQLLIASLFLALSLIAAHAGIRPDIVVFLSDDHGQLDSTPYSATDVCTPNMQRMANEGLTFNRAFVASPACAPSRAAMLTGLMPARNGAEANHQYKRDDVRSLPGVLRELGYETAAFGKVAHGKDDVKRHGFDVIKDKYDAATIGKYLSERDVTKPLCLFVGTHQPHVPWPRNEGYDPAQLKLPPTLLDTAMTREFRARYYTDVTQADTDLGVVLDLAAKHLVATNTLMIYTSDHGAQWPFGKWNLYDAGTAVPMIAAWEGVIKPGTRTDALVQWIDLLPTLIEAAGGKVPEGIDGKSFNKVLAGKSDSHRDAIFTTHSGDGKMNVYPIRAIRAGDWKLILNLHPEFAHTTHIDKAQARDGGAYWNSWFEAAQTNASAAARVKPYHERPAVELYDLKSDPFETNNLAAAPAQAGRVKELRARLEAWMQGQGDKQTVFNEPRLLADAASTHPGKNSTTDTPTKNKPNVLLILVDDLKPALGAYGDTTAKSPALDKLAASGMRFDLAYANQAVCTPSRFNLMLGSRSTSSGLYDLSSNLRQRLPNAVTLPQYFSRNGYHSQSLGKVFHIGHGNLGDPESFDAPHFRDFVVEYALAESTGGQLTKEEALFNNAKGPNKDRPRGPAWENADVPDTAYADGRVADETIKRLEAWKQNPEKPFFIASGYARPHLPFTAPKKYWDLYDPAKLPMPQVLTPPEGAPAYGIKRGGEIDQYTPVPLDGQVDSELTRKLIHGYYASVSYVDAQIGKVLDALDRLGLAENTIVVLWGDHGFHLGDHGIWTKHTNYEQATRIPLVIRAPGVTRAGSSTLQLAETVDIYPTLCELAGLPAPKAPQPMDGESLVPVLKNPEARVSDFAYHCFPRNGYLGRAIRTERYRFIEPVPLDAANGNKPAVELYDYQVDPLEKRNIAAEKPEVVAKLKAILDRQPQPVMSPKK